MAIDGRPRPEWWDATVSDYQASVAKCFTLYGNVFDVADLATDDHALIDDVALALTRVFCLVQFTPDGGITFPFDRDRVNETRFRNTVMGEGSPDGGDPIAQMLAQRQGAGQPNEKKLPSSPGQVIPLLVKWLETKAPNTQKEVEEAKKQGEDYLSLDSRPPAVLVDRLDLIAPPDDKARAGEKVALLAALHRLGTSPALDRTGGLAIFLTPTMEEVHQDLRAGSSGYRFIQVPPPDHEQRLRYINLCLEKHGVTMGDLSAEEFAGLTAGLLRRHLEDVILRAKRTTDKGVTKALVLTRKKEQISSEYEDVIEVVEPDHGLADVFGAELQVSFINRKILKPIRDPRKVHLAPKSILLSGPSGTGKTWLAEGIAGDIGWTFIKGNIGKLRGGIVGQSDRLTEKFFTGCRSMAPCVVFFDEFDQQTRRGEGGPDSGGGGQVENSLFARILEFFGDPKIQGKMLVITATNRPKLIDPAMVRPGRLGDVKMPCLPPKDAGERAAIALGVMGRYGLPKNRELAEVIGKRTTDEWTQAEIDALVRFIRNLVELEDMPVVEATAEALDDFRPNTREIRSMTLEALAETSHASLVPEKWRDKVGMAAERQIKQDEQDEADGRGRVGSDLEF